MSGVMPLQPDATRSGCLPVVVGYTWDGFRLILGAHGLVGWPVAEPCGILWDGRSAVSQGAVYAGVGGVVAVVEALGVDAEQDFDAVPRSLGDARWGDSGG